MLRTSAVLLSLTLVGAPLALAAEKKESPAANVELPLISHAYFYDADKQRIGEALLRETPHGVLVTLDLKDLPPGDHGFHFHETGKCEPPFESSGGHFNPLHKHHGFAVPNGPHAGDLPNLYVLENRTIRTEFLDPDTTLMPGRPNSLYDQDGAAMIVHAGGDDYASDPSGNSGDRIACGVIEKPEKVAKGGIIPRPWEREGGTATSGAGKP